MEGADGSGKEAMNADSGCVSRPASGPSDLTVWVKLELARARSVGRGLSAEGDSRLGHGDAVAGGTDG